MEIGRFDANARKATPVRFTVPSNRDCICALFRRSIPVIFLSSLRCLPRKPIVMVHFRLSNITNSRINFILFFRRLISSSNSNLRQILYWCVYFVFFCRYVAVVCLSLLLRLPRKLIRHDLFPFVQYSK